MPGYSFSKLGELIETLKHPITPKENFKRAIRRTNPLWVPVEEDIMTFNPRIYPDYIARAFVVEANPYEGSVGGRDVFGVNWIYDPQVRGSMVKPGNPILLDANDWGEAIRFPDLDEWDWEESAAENIEYVRSDKLVRMWVLTGFFERLISFMDFEGAAVALIDEGQKSAVKALFQRLADFYIDLLSHYKKFYGFDEVYFHDDWGAQSAPFFSIQTLQEMIIPYLKQVVDFCHVNGVIFELHSCGMNEDLVPAMIEAGVDAWCGQSLNDKQKLYDLYGARIAIGREEIPGPLGENPTEDELERWAEATLAGFIEDMPEKCFYMRKVLCDGHAAEVLHEVGMKELAKLEEEDHG